MPKDYRLKVLFWSSIVSITLFLVIIPHIKDNNKWESYQQSTQQTIPDGHQRSMVPWQQTHLDAIQPQPSTFHVRLILLPILSASKECCTQHIHASLTMSLSLHTCPQCTTPSHSNNSNEIDTVHQTCTFTNIVLYRGNLFYIAPDDGTARATIIPSPLIFEVGNSPSNDFSLPKIMSVTTAEKLTSMVRSTLDKSRSNRSSSANDTAESGSSGGGGHHRRTAQSVASDSTNSIGGPAAAADDSNGLRSNNNNNTISGSIKQQQQHQQRHHALHMADFHIGIFQRTRTFTNWFWALNGAGNAFHRLCKFFDVCTIESIKESSVILQPLIKTSYNLSGVGYVGLPSHHAYAMHDLMSCFGPLLW